MEANISDKAIKEVEVTFDGDIIRTNISFFIILLKKKYVYDNAKLNNNLYISIFYNFYTCYVRVSCFRFF